MWRLKSQRIVVDSFILKKGLDARGSAYLQGKNYYNFARQCANLIELDNHLKLHKFYDIHLNTSLKLVNKYYPFIAKSKLNEVLDSWVLCQVYQNIRCASQALSSFTFMKCLPVCLLLWYTIYATRYYVILLNLLLPWSIIGRRNYRSKEVLHSLHNQIYYFKFFSISF